MVPIGKHAKMGDVENAFVPDDDILAERWQNEQYFAEEFRMAGKYCSEFGRELMIAIDQDKGNLTPGTSIPYSHCDGRHSYVLDESLMEQERPTFSSWTENHSQLVVSAWKKKHFSGMWHTSPLPQGLLNSTLIDSYDQSGAGKGKHQSCCMV
jgi:hypothetical protein